jgi:hypothetical protein
VKGLVTRSFLQNGAIEKGELGKMKSKDGVLISKYIVHWELNI